MTRHDFSASDKKLLAERVGYHCSNPFCGVSTIGPSMQPNQKEYVGVAAHIYSASVDNGPRANPQLTEDERSSIDNGIHLCNKCSTLIDKNNGAGYPAEVLFNWKKTAEANARARVYQNNLFQLFKEVEFTNLEQKYSTALTCTGLNDKNVTSCPSNAAVVTEVLKNLNLAYKCIIVGKSGSGKSLLTYQAAYELFKNGWSVFNIDKSCVSDLTAYAAPKDKAIIIIDDAQTLEVRHLENILNAAHESFFILANWNESTSIDNSFMRSYPTVEIAPKSQVELLKRYCLINKDVLIKSLKAIGISINKKDYFSRIETRIERASNEETPWLFNYHLTEGWNTAKQDLYLLQNEDHLNLVIVTVAIYQFATLDKGVNNDTILHSLKMFSDNQDWLDKANRTLRKYCTLQDGIVRNKHYEYSRRVLKIFTSQTDSNDEFKYLIDVIMQILTSQTYLSGHANILEFVMFDFRKCHYELNRSGFIVALASKLLTKTDTRKLSPYIVEKLNSLIRFNKETLSELERNQDVLDYWLINCNRETVYALGNLCNTLHNEKYTGITISRELIQKLVSNIICADIEDKSRFAYLLNRLSLSFTESDSTYASNELLKSKFTIDISAYSSSTVCYQFSSLISHLSNISPSWANEQVQNNIDGIADLLNNDLMRSYRDFKELIDHYFGIVSAILGVRKINSEISKRGRKLANKIKVDSILKGFNSVEAVDVQSFGMILIFIALYDKHKLKEISDKFDYERLGMLYENEIELDHYHRALISTLRIRNSKNYMDYLSKVIMASKHIDDFFIVLNPELSLERLRIGVKYKMSFHSCSECADELLILHAILEEKDGKELVKRILFENEMEIAKAIFSKSQNVDDKKGKFDFLVFIHSFLPQLYAKIFNNEKEIIGLIEKIKRLLRGKQQEKNIARLYVFLIKTYTTNTYADITNIEKRYPTLKSFEIAKCIE